MRSSRRWPPTQRHSLRDSTNSPPGNLSINKQDANNASSFPLFAINKQLATPATIQK